MSATPDIIPGYETPVHQSILKPNLSLYAPHKPAVLNLFVSIGMVVSLRVIGWVVVGVLIHVGMALAAVYDHFLPEIFRQSFGRKSYYGV